MQNLVHLVWLLPLLFLVVYIGSPRFLGTTGSVRVQRLLAAGLEKRRYVVLRNLTLAAGGGTQRFEHLVVSQFGIFVIDTIHRSGWISGTQVQALWQQRTFGRVIRFDNPVHANALRIEALVQLLRLPVSRFHPMVVFSGHKGFKTPPPNMVMPVSRTLGHINAQRRQLLTAEEVDRAVQQIRDACVHVGVLTRLGPWKMLRALLLVILLAATYLIFGQQLRMAVSHMQQQADMRMQPTHYHPDGKAKSQQEIWEESLICAYSPDSGSCACYEPRGKKAQLSLQRCRELAERGSILNQ